MAVCCGETSIAGDFANFTVLNGSIRGTVWNDINRNGARDINSLTGAFIDPGLANWTVYGHSREFWAGLRSRGQKYVTEVPVSFYGWTQKPGVTHRT